MMLLTKGYGLRAISCFVAFIALTLSMPKASGQIVGNNNSYPPAQYYLGFPQYYQGEYRSAFSNWKNATGAYQIGTTRFLDSACYWTMAGECEFHSGNFAAAINFYEQALSLVLQRTNENWQSNIQAFNIPNILPNAVQRTQITWGVPMRSMNIPSLPDTMRVLFGQVGAVDRALQNGGVVLPPELKGVDVAEIMRCASLAIYRRHDIMGGVCKFQPLTLNLAVALEGQNVNDGSLIGAWNGVLLGLSYASIEDWDNAKKTLEQALQFGQGMDHPLTPIALLALAKINWRSGDVKTANFMALEASYSAAVYNQYDLMAESLSFGAMLHMATKQSGVYPPLQNAIVWSRRNNALAPQIWSALRLAECFTEAGDTASSTRILNDVFKSFSRSGFGSGELNSRANYLTAVNLFTENNYDDGRVRLATAVTEYATVSRWLVQLVLTERMLLAGTISERHAEAMYESLLRDPAEAEWRSEPIEAIAFLATPHLDSIARWLLIVGESRNYPKMVEIDELYRRHRFFSALPLGGRDLALRWMLHAPKESLPQSAIDQRIDFLTRYDGYKTLSEQLENTRQQLAKQPIQMEQGSAEQKAQLKKFVEMLGDSKTLETMLAKVALRREPAEMVFPPQPVLTDLVSDLEPNQTIVYVIATPTHHLFLEISIRGTKLLSSVTNKDLGNALKKLFSDTELNERQIKLENLEKIEWQEIALKLTELLLPKLNLEDYAGRPPQLTIVPDGLAWYLPFELLRLKNERGEASWLCDRVAIRYAPTLGIATLCSRTAKPWQRTAFFTGQINDELKQPISAEAFAELQKQYPSIVDFPERLDIPSNLFGSTVDELIVWSDLEGTPKGGAFAITPVIKDRAVAGSNLAAWMSLPWQGAEHIVLPTFASQGANGPKGKFNGDELFLATTAMFASGARTIVLSRWPTQGQSALTFTEAYWKRSKEMPTTVAFQETIREMRETQLDMALESRVDGKKEAVTKTASHPLFWAGYMLLETPVLSGAGERIDAMLQNQGAAQPGESAEPDPEAAKDQQPMKAEEKPANVDPDMENAADPKPEVENPQKKDDKKDSKNGKDSGKKESKKDDKNNSSDDDTKKSES